MLVKRSAMRSGNGRSVAELAELPSVELAGLAAAGEREAFDPLFRRFGPRLMTWAVRRTNGDAALAQDIASETWAALVAGAERFQGDGTDEGFARWMFGVAHGALLRALRNRWRETSSELMETFTDREQPASEDLEAADKREMLAQLRAAVEELPPTLREVARMRLDNLSNAEIARRTGSTAERVKWAWESVQTSLRRKLLGEVTGAGRVVDDPELMRAAVDQLAPRMRQVALLRLAGKSHADVVRATGLSSNQAGAAWWSAQKRLRQLMSNPTALRRASDPNWAAQQDKQAAAMRAATEHLTPAVRQVVLLRLDGVSNTDIAQRLNRTNSAVKQAWYSARDTFIRQGVLAA